MKKITQEEFNNFKRHNNGILYLPTGDYSLIKTFGKWCSFGEGCSFGEECSFGAGTVLANFRFDERNISVEIEGESVDTGRDKFGAIIGNDSKTGVNVSILPGVKIGPNSIVGPHVCLTDDLEPDTIILAEPVHKTVRKSILSKLASPPT